MSPNSCHEFIRLSQAAASADQRWGWFCLVLLLVPGHGLRDKIDRTATLGVNSSKQMGPDFEVSPDADLTNVEARAHSFLAKRSSIVLKIPDLRNAVRHVHGQETKLELMMITMMMILVMIPNIPNARPIIAPVC